ncbi:MAG: arsenate reductase [Gammaproteobacteria bacterium]|nr:MAG: arsenate reductase [Gammaproteobacteria bacterium]
MIDLYGITNCDTVRKARRWLEEHGVDYRFHDFRKEPPNRDQISRWLNVVGDKVLVNRRGQTWRRLPEDVRAALDPDKVVDLLMEHPTLIKRPVVELEDGTVEVGFSEARYEELFS